LIELGEVGPKASRRQDYLAQNLCEIKRFIDENAVSCRYPRRPNMPCGP
jgi:hypothetical protein